MKKQQKKQKGRIRSYLLGITATALILSGGLNYYLLKNITLVGGYTDEQRMAMNALVEAVQ
jgi:hypothetical protein